MKNFFNLSDLSEKDLNYILSDENNDESLEGKSIGLIFEKYSTRTRLSFSSGILQLNGNIIDINFDSLNISRNESFEDTFLAMNCYLDGLVYRTTDHNRLVQASKFFDKPIINALSDLSHPCQAISDLFTLKERFGSLKLNILWIGDLNNVTYSLIEAVKMIEELNLVLCTPKEIFLNKKLIIPNNIKVFHNIKDLELSTIDCVMTDVFISMNDKNDDYKKDLLKPFSVTEKLMLNTSKNSVFMHCLPAIVGSEVSKEVFYSEKSIVWQQAYNRKVAQNKLLQIIDWS